MRRAVGSFASALRLLAAVTEAVRRHLTHN
jgi:hypothetical protein